MSIFVAFDIFHIENVAVDPKQVGKRRWVPMLWLLIGLSVPYHNLVFAQLFVISVDACLCLMASFIIQEV